MVDAVVASLGSAVRGVVDSTTKLVSFEGESSPTSKDSRMTADSLGLIDTAAASLGSAVRGVVDSTAGIVSFKGESSPTWKDLRKKSMNNYSSTDSCFRKNSLVPALDSEEMVAALLVCVAADLLDLAVAPS